MLSQSPIGRLGQPEEVAHGALFLASDEASFITGAWLVIDGDYIAHWCKDARFARRYVAKSYRNGARNQEGAATAGPARCP